MNKIKIRISRNPFEILAYIGCILSVFAFFTTTSIPFVTYILIGSVLLYACTAGSLGRCISSWYFIYIVFLVLFVLLYSTNVNISDSTMVRSTLFQLIPCLIFFVFVMTDHRATNKMFIWIALSVLILCVIILTDEALLETLKNTDEQGIYYSYEENNRNTIGVLLALGSLYMLHLGFTKHKLFFVLMLAPVLLGLVTGSRKSIITVIAGLILYTFLYSIYCMKRKRSKRAFALFFVAMAILGLVYACYNNETLYNIIGFRLEGLIGTLTGGKTTEASAVIRSKMIEKAFDMFKEKPIFGWGIEGFAAHSGFGVYCHNNYMEMLVSYGLVGFIFIYFFKIKLLWDQFKLLRHNRCEDSKEIAVILFLAVLMIVSFVLDMAMVSITDVSSNLAFALAAANQQMHKQRLKAGAENL